MRLTKTNPTNKDSSDNKSIRTRKRLSIGKNSENSNPNITAPPVTDAPLNVRKRKIDDVTSSKPTTTTKRKRRKAVEDNKAWSKKKESRANQPRTKSTAPLNTNFQNAFGRSDESTEYVDEDGIKQPLKYVMLLDNEKLPPHWINSPVEANFANAIGNINDHQIIEKIEFLTPNKKTVQAQSGTPNRTVYKPVVDLGFGVILSNRLQPENKPFTDIVTKDKFEASIYAKAIQPMIGNQKINEFEISRKRLNTVKNARANSDKERSQPAVMKNPNDSAKLARATNYAQDAGISENDRKWEFSHGAGFQFAGDATQTVNNLSVASHGANTLKIHLENSMVWLANELGDDAFQFRSEVDVIENTHLGIYELIKLTIQFADYPDAKPLVLEHKINLQYAYQPHFDFNKFVKTRVKFSLEQYKAELEKNYPSFPTTKFSQSLSIFERGKNRSVNDNRSATNASKIDEISNEIKLILPPSLNTNK